MLLRFSGGHLILSEDTALKYAEARSVYLVQVNEGTRISDGLFYLPMAHSRSSIMA